MTGEFKPKILAFLCNWCSYAGADTAGGMHKPVPDCIHVIRVMCTGRVDPQFVIKAFKDGADGVLVLGCHPGDCHYKAGNYKAANRMKLLHNLLEQVGIEKERFFMDWVSAREGEKFSQVAASFAATVARLGPLCLNPSNSRERK